MKSNGGASQAEPQPNNKQNASAQLHPSPRIPGPAVPPPDTSGLQEMSRLFRPPFLVRLLLEWGADVNAPANKHKHGGKPALQTAAPENHRVMTDLLVHQGAGVNGVPSPVRGRTALQEAASSGYVQLSEYLLAHGADADALAEHLGGVTALQGAATRGNIRIVMMLRPAGVDVHGAAAENGRLDTLHL
ncbi:ankyrin repeat protein [Aspergillus fumigatus A1163]|uniref:Ankyrin repeat protein n=1 Tax=Aspergillus fumigatus (strain CBS 144.89 / FGSC A1163 / CEA10) TaxID=451804 RepID=B0Y6A8_ASPFC|nr:ankyrin repeat protein [Aspergillus fumigatus A1163]